ncbi:hypothetical protein B0H14DRAFT_3429831 [Mycena olivaceomarginata]|nr:hypothetical protein B0H14DRAFT_3429831 [Mycena olivaceomarginata]
MLLTKFCRWLVNCFCSLTRLVGLIVGVILHSEASTPGFGNPGVLEGKWRNWLGTALLAPQPCGLSLQTGELYISLDFSLFSALDGSFQLPASPKGRTAIVDLVCASYAVMQLLSRTYDALSRHDRPTSETAQQEFFGNYLEYTHLTWGEADAAHGITQPLPAKDFGTPRPV